MAEHCSHSLSFEASASAIALTVQGVYAEIVVVIGVAVAGITTSRAMVVDLVIGVVVVVVVVVVVAVVVAAAAVAAGGRAVAGVRVGA